MNQATAAPAADPTATAPIPAGTQLISLDPKTYVAAVVAPFRERLAKAIAAAAAIKEVDVSTAAAMQVAIKHRAEFREIRIDLEKERGIRKAPILEIGRLLDGRARELTAEIETEEDRFDGAIKAEEKRREDERHEGS